MSIMQSFQDFRFKYGFISRKEMNAANRQAQEDAKIKYREKKARRPFDHIIIRPKYVHQWHTNFRYWVRRKWDKWTQPQFSLPLYLDNCDKTPEFDMTDFELKPLEMPNTSILFMDSTLIHSRGIEGEKQ